MSAQHEKTWVVDEKLYVCGSANGTRNSQGNCEEAVLFVKDPSIVGQALEHFHGIWETGVILTPQLLVDAEAAHGRSCRSRSAGASLVRASGSVEEEAEMNLFEFGSVPEEQGSCRVPLGHDGAAAVSAGGAGLARSATGSSDAGLQGRASARAAAISSEAPQLGFAAIGRELAKYRKDFWESDR